MPVMLPRSVVVMKGGVTALVSSIDLERISAFKWRPLKESSSGEERIYAYREDDGCLISMHQEILGLLPGLIVDHINGNTLDNTRENLRYVTPSQNAQNRRKRDGTTSDFKGVTVVPAKYRARIRLEDGIKNLGDYDDEETAARMYDLAAIKYFGRHAKLNFPRK